jgi:predicted kinase
MPTLPTLIVLGGLPGSGKSTIAKILARQMALVYLRVDEIEQALLRHRPGVDVGTAGYGVAYAVASANLALGLGVVADSVNPVGASRAGWAAAGRHAAILAVEIICSDPAVHRCRVEQRSADIAGHALPTWADVEALAYEPWPDVDLVVDTASKTAAEAVSLIANAAAQLR